MPLKCNFNLQKCRFSISCWRYITVSGGKAYMKVEVVERAKDHSWLLALMYHVQGWVLYLGLG